MEMIVNSRYTEICASGGGGGNFLTQSAPTNFHLYLTRKKLLPGEKAEAWREITAEERAELEAQDAAWQEPPQAFIDMWEAVCRQYYIEWRKCSIGGYNRDTGFFELNGILNLTYAEAMDILVISRLQPADDATRFFGHSWFSSNTNKNRVCCRTYFPVKALGLGANYTDAFRGNKMVEVLRLESYYGDSCVNDGTKYVRAGAAGQSTFKGAFCGCTALRDVGGLGNSTIDAETFKDCEALEEVSFCPYGDRNHVYDFRWSPRLSYKSLWAIVGWKGGAADAPVTITLHPEVYARVDEALLERAASQLITFATPA